MAHNTNSAEDVGEHENPALRELRAKVLELHQLYADQDKFDDEYEDEHGRGLESYDKHEFDSLEAIYGAARRLLNLPEPRWGTGTPA